MLEGFLEKKRVFHAFGENKMLYWCTHTKAVEMHPPQSRSSGPSRVRRVVDVAHAQGTGEIWVLGEICLVGEAEQCLCTMNRRPEPGRALQPE